MNVRDYSTDELLMMVNNVTGEYSEEEVRLAKKELYKRGINDELIADIVEEEEEAFMKEEEEAFMKRLDAAARAEQARIDKRNEKNRNISYQWWELLILFVFAPFYLCRRCYLPHNFFPKLRQLREEKYDLKFKQRLIALIAGDIVWVLAYWIERVIMGN